jgi:hypothetical protein
MERRNEVKELGIGKRNWERIRYAYDRSRQRECIAWCRIKPPYLIVEDVSAPVSFHDTGLIIRILMSKLYY